MSEQLFKISFEYDFKPIPWQIEKIAELLNISPDKVDMQENGCLGWGSRDVTCTLKEAQAIGSKFTVEKPTGLCRYEASEAVQFREREIAPVNLKCNVIVAGTTIIDIKKVYIETDLCTESLQARLDDGWKILAICVQPDQRRPDYVLGR